MNGRREDSGTSRRAVLGLGLAGLVWGLSGCDVSPEPTAPSSSPSTDSPDRALASRTADQLAALGTTVGRVTRTHRSLAQGGLQGFARLHRVQLRRIGIEPSDPGPSPLPRGWKGDPTKAADAVRALEADAAQGFASSAMPAESGVLAGLLAQLAAGIDMQLAATAEALGSLDVEPEIPSAAPTIQVEAMQKTLADEHAALYLYGVLGAHTSASRTPALYAAVDAAYAAHRARRDRLTALLEDAGEDPAVSEPGYRIPAPLRTDEQIAAEGLRLERGTAARYLWLVENSTDDVRALGVAALRNTAVRELGFRGVPEPFPGSDADA